MNFSIDSAAKKYVNERFSYASQKEKEKIIQDWNSKKEDSTLLVKDFIRRVGNPVGKKVLDIGCGNGGVSIAFSKAGAIVTGVDIESELISIAKQYSDHEGVSTDFKLYNGGILPFDNETFDYAVSVSVLEHTTDPIFYLSQIFRVLKKGGVLYLGFPNKLWPKETHTGLWFLTYVPQSFRNQFVKIFHKNPLEENNLHFYNYYNLVSMIEAISIENRIHLIEEKGSSTSIIKRVLRNVLVRIGIPYKAFLPHILVLIKKDE